MSLLSVDITKVKRISLELVLKPTSEDKPIQVDIPPTAEEIAYSKLVAINPLIEELLQELQPVSIYTGKPIRKVKLPQDIIDKINRVI
jgi:hypothetical protein